MKPQDISKDPDMIELERMIETGELDGDRVTEYADEQLEKELSRKISLLSSKKLYKPLSPREIKAFPQELADILGKKKSAIRLVKFKSAGIGPTEACGGIPAEYKLNTEENKAKRRSGNSLESSEERAGGD